MARSIVLVVWMLKLVGATIAVKPPRNIVLVVWMLILSCVGAAPAKEPLSRQQERSYSGPPGPLVISSIVNGQTHALAKEVLKQAYERIGRPVEFKPAPARRALASANDGETDGDIARIQGTGKIFTNLVAVPTPVIDFQGVAFTKSVTKSIRTWNDLKGLKIGVVRGVRYAAIGTEGLDRYFAEDIPHLFKLLADGRIDVAVAGLRAGKIEIRKNHGNSGIRTIGEPLFSAPLYHVLHKRNKAIVPHLDTVLADMAEQGEIDAIIDQAFQNMLDQEP